MERYRADTYGESFADVYDDWYRDVSDAEAVARFVTARAAGHPVLELGVGTGRLAAPLVATGLSVVGVDASPSMLDRCARRDLGPALTLVRADMAALPLRGRRFGVVLIGFNTLFNLATEADQIAVFAQVADLLTGDGRLVVEANQVEVPADGPGCWVEPGLVDAGARHLTVVATALEPATQTIVGHHVELSDTGIRFRPWQLRWATPAQLDGYADLAGLRLVERYGSWGADPFPPDGDVHVSVYGTRR